MRVELHLLPILDTLLTERSVSRTAARLHLTQPAISYALAKLRSQIGDPLLVKSGNRMLPTERALALAGPLRAALAQIESCVSSSAQFDPPSTEGEVHFGVGDYSAYVVMPRVLDVLLREAPKLKICLHRIGAGIAEVVEAAQAFDMCFSRSPKVPPALGSEVLFDDIEVLVARKNHPIFDHPIDMAAYLKYPHLAATSQHGIRPSGADDILEAKGLVRPIRVALPEGMHLTLTGLLGDAISTIPARFAAMFSGTTGTRMAKLPFESPKISVSLVWHRRHDQSALHKWLRGIVCDVGKQIAAEPSQFREAKRRGKKPR